VTHLDEADLVLPHTQRFHDAVDAVAGRPKTVFTPQSIRVSMSMSDAFIFFSPCRWDAGGFVRDSASGRTIV